MDLPRFNQHFIRTLPVEGTEREFVGAVGEVAFMMRRSAEGIARIDHELRRPFMLGQYRPDEEAVHRATFTHDFEKALEHGGMSDVVIAARGLQNALGRMRGRSLSWATSTFRRGNEPAYDTGYLIGDKIGFYHDMFITPSLFVQVADEASATNGIYMNLGDMWDIRVDPKEG